MKCGGVSKWWTQSVDQNAVMQIGSTPDAELKREDGPCDEFAATVV